MGVVNALLIGTTLALIEQAIKGLRGITVQDVFESMGQYFWDVIGVGFVLWIPTMLLDTSLRANPDSQFLVAACLLLVFILLNPAPEVIYLTRHDSALDVIRRSYDFVIENWIEWFLPMALILAPLGLSLFFKLSSRLGRGAGLDFLQLLLVPFTILTAWLTDLGISSELTGTMALLLTPPSRLPCSFSGGICSWPSPPRRGDSASTSPNFETPPHNPLGRAPWPDSARRAKRRTC